MKRLLASVLIVTTCAITVLPAGHCISALFHQYCSCASLQTSPQQAHDCSCCQRKVSETLEPQRAERFVNSCLFHPQPCCPALIQDALGTQETSRQSEFASALAQDAWIALPGDFPYWQATDCDPGNQASVVSPGSSSGPPLYLRLRTILL